MPPFLHTTLKQKWGGGICSNIQFVSCIRPSLCSLQSSIRARSTIKTTAAAFRKNGSFDERVLQEIRCACIDIVSGDRGRPHVSSHFQCEQLSNIKPGGGQTTRLHIVICVYVFRTQSMMELLKACPEDTRYGAFTRGKSIYPKQELWG